MATPVNRVNAEPLEISIPEITKRKSLVKTNASIEGRLATIVYFVTLDVTFASYSRFVAKLTPAGREIGRDRKRISNCSRAGAAQTGTLREEGRDLSEGYCSTVSSRLRSLHRDF
jgi:hypothetical protein